MATNLLDEAQTLNKTIDNTQGRADTMQQDLALQQQAQQFLADAEAKKEKARQDALATVEQSRANARERTTQTDPNDLMVRQAQMLEAGASKREQRVEARSRSTSERRFDYVTRTFVKGEAPTRSADVVEQATRVKLSVGVSPLGAALPEVQAPKVTMTGADLEGIKADNDPSSNFPAVRQSIEQSYGGSRALKLYDEKARTVLGEVEANLESAKDSDGLVDKKKLYELAVNTKSFDPTVAPTVKRMLDDVVLIENARQGELLKVRKLAQEVKLNEIKIDAVQMAGITNGAMSRVDNALTNDKDPAPDLTMLMRSGLSSTEYREAAKRRIESTEDKKNEREALQYKYGKQFRPDADMGALGESSQPVAEQTERIQEITSRIPDLYNEAVAQGKDIQSFILDNVLEAGDMNDAEMFEFIGQVVDLVDGEITTRVGERVKQVKDVAGQQARATVEGAYRENAFEYYTGAKQLSELINSDSYKAAETPEARATVAKMFLSGKAEGQIQAVIGKERDIYSLEQTMAEADMIADSIAVGRIPEEADEYQMLSEELDAFAAFAESEFDTDGKRMRLEEATISAELASRGWTSAYKTIPIGGKVYGVPVDLFTKPIGQAFGMYGEIGAERASMSLAQMLNNYGDNEYVKGLLNGLADNKGVITAESGALSRLARIVTPPSTETLKLYDDKVRSRVADAYATYPEQARERKVLDVTDISTVAGEEADAPYTMDEYSRHVATTLAASEGKNGAEQMNAAIAALDAAMGVVDDRFDFGTGWRDKQVQHSASRYLRDGGLREALWNNGQKDKAIALSYIAMKEDQERELAAIAMGGQGFKGEVPGLKSRIEKVVLANPVEGGTWLTYDAMVSSMNTLKRTAETSRDYNELIALRDELSAWADGVGLDLVRTDVEDYRKKEKELVERFSGNNDGSAKMAPAVANEFAAMATEYKGDAKQRIDTVVGRGENILKMYEDMVDIINARTGVALSESGVTYTTFGGKKYDIINPSTPVTVR